MNHAAAPSTASQAARPRRRLWKAFIRPGARLMGKLRLSTKLALLTSVLCVPILILLGQTFYGLATERAAAVVARQGATTVREVARLYASLQRLRALSVMVARGDAALEGPRTQEMRRAGQLLRAVDQLIGPDAPGTLKQTWLPVRLQVEAIAQGAFSVGAPGARDAIASTLDHLHELMHHVAEAAGLAQRGNAASRNLSRLVVDGAIHVLEIGGAMSAHGAWLLADRPAATLHSRSIGLGLAVELERDVERLAHIQQDLAFAGVAAPGGWPTAHEMLLRLARNLQRQFGAESLEGTPRAHFDAVGQAMDYTQSLMQDALNRLDAEFDARIAGIEQRLLLLGMACVLGTMLVAYLFLAFYVSFHHALRQILAGMQATAKGDLSHQVRIRGRDELAEIARAFDQMSERLSGTTAEIRSHAARVDQAGRQVAEGTQQLAQRTDEQSRSVSGTAIAIGELNAAVAQNAKATRDVDALTERLFGQAEAGNQAMAETVLAMDELVSASAKVAEVVSVIDDVAFQTGMLALNAAVEAARAGAAGKGFAVVAGEVRQLALRCGESADEIRQLITASGSQAQDAAGRLQHVSVALDTLVNGVREVSSQLRGIATSTTQQSAALEDVRSNITSLEAITRDNAALVEESQSSSNALVAQGGALKETVASMRLRHGSADEARELVERALAHAKRVGRSQATLDFSQPASEWVDRDLFIFCFDRLGNILANGLTPSHVGNNVNNLDGLRGTHHSDRMWDCVDNGGGWVRYEIVHPNTGKLTPKESYVRALDEHTLVGCGCYGRPYDSIDAARAPKGPVTWSRRQENKAFAPA